VTVLERRGVKPALWIAGIVVILAVLRPWTVRPLEGDKPAAFDPGTYATSLWPRVLDEAGRLATDVAAPADGGTAKARFVKGSGVVTTVDRTSRVGLIRLQMPGKAPADVAIQIGPVIRGTTLRDAAGFIQFSDFTNQSDYAAAANALNDHVLRSVVGPINLDALTGRTIRFTGAAPRSAAPGAPLEVVPVSLVVIEAGHP